MMVCRIYKTRDFIKWCKQFSFEDVDLLSIYAEIEKGMVDAYLGSGLIKKRVRKAGSGKRSGYRMLLAYQHQDCCIFISAFSKSEQDNITQRETEVFKAIAKVYLNMNTNAFTQLIKNKQLYEVKHDQ